jgi:RNA polymerase sigma-70 factor, ECF subfamily
VPGRDPFDDPQPLIRRVYAYVAYRIGDGPDAEAVTSATCERALHYRHRFDGRKEDATAWLVGIAGRQIVEHFGAPRELEADVVARTRLGAAVAGLCDRDRELIALRYGADLTTRQIGELLGMQTTVVDLALHRTLDTLRDLIEQ